MHVVKGPGTNNEQIKEKGAYILQIAFVGGHEICM